MRNKAIFATLAILLAFPAGVRAQQAGFIVGIGSRPQHAQIGQHGRVRTQPAHRGGGVVQSRRGSAFPQHGSIFPQHGTAFPHGGRTFPQRGRGFPQLGTAFPRRGGTFPQGGMVVPRGAVVFVGPPAINIAPNNARRHEPRTPTHPVVAPGVTVITPGTGRVFTGRRPRTPIGVQPGVQIFQPGIGPAIAVRGRNRHSGNQPVVNIVLGTSRDAVIARLGRPRVQILKRNSETMIFGGTTIIIENGVVALIR